jgi:hypothetical protein
MRAIMLSGPMIAAASYGFSTALPSAWPKRTDMVNAGGVRVILRYAGWKGIKGTPAREYKLNVQGSKRLEET